MANPSSAEDVTQAVAKFQSEVGRLREQIGTVIVGHREIVDGVLTALFAGGHVLLEGVPGLGKTLLIRTLAETLDLAFSRIQFTPDLMPADILGTNLIVEDERGGRNFAFQRGPVFSNIVLADEINRATPKTQSALLEAMSERSVTIAKETMALPNPFFVLATQNPLEMEGTYPLPEAQLDRFFAKLKVRSPNREALHTILDRTTTEATPKAGRVIDAAELIKLKQLVLSVPVTRAVQDYVVRIVEGTQPHPTTKDAKASATVTKFVRYGASPRGAQSLLLGAKIAALLDGRFTVAHADVRAMVKPTLRHRLILNFEGEAEGIESDAILDTLVKETPE